jgi:hypothetical protein
MTSEPELESRAEGIFNETYGDFECFEIQMCTYETTSGTDIAGNYLIAKIQKVVDPSRDDEPSEESYGRALLWEEGLPGKNSSLLVSISSINTSMGELIDAAKNINASR